MGSDLIPRKILFGNPNRASVRISPDGKQLSYLSADEGVMNVWTAPIDDPENGTVVTQDRTTGISQYFWAYTCRHILYLQDTDGDEDFHLYCVDLDTKQVIDLTPFESIAAQVNHLSHRYPEEILVGINNRDEHWFHDIYRINLVSGERTLVEQNDGFIGYTADDDLQLKLAFTMTPTSDLILFKPDEQQPGTWQEFLTIESTEVMTTSPISLDKTGQLVYMLDSRNRDKAAITCVDMKTGAGRVDI